MQDQGHSLARSVEEVVKDVAVAARLDIGVRPSGCWQCLEDDSSQYVESSATLCGYQSAPVANRSIDPGVVAVEDMHSHGSVCPRVSPYVVESGIFELTAGMLLQDVGDVAQAV